MVTAAVVFLGVALVGTSTTWFCSLCHIHKAAVQQYKKSTHAKVNCEQCHSRPGPFFFLTAKMEALQQPVHQLMGDFEEPIVAGVMNQSCRRCHDKDILSGPVVVDGITVEHAHLVAAGYKCIRCHSTVAHGDAVPSGSRTYPTMDQCLVCHNNKYKAADGTVASARCGLCHAAPGYSAKPANHDATWIETHGSEGILSTCSACHVRADACSKCHHSVEMPHADKWLEQHGSTAQELGERACKQCHDTPQYCDGCHVVKVPHPAGWIGRHDVQAARHAQSCLNCHDTDNCQACHRAHGSGKPQAHDFLKDKVPAWKPSPTPSPTPTA